MAQAHDDYQRTVPDGTLLSDAVSILIKELRAGHELEALYWARQIEDKFYKYVWRRLEIFACEDVGLANPFLIVIVGALKSAYMTHRAESSKDKPDTNIIAMAVLLLARSAKNREVDNLKNVLGALMKEAGWQPEIPEHALDSHTSSGRNDPRFRDPAFRAMHWFTVASRVTPEVGPMDAYLWHLRNLSRSGAGVLPREDVDAMEAGWREEGRLVYEAGSGYPEVPDDTPWKG
jgi:hypothetical protein